LYQLFGCFEVMVEDQKPEHGWRESQLVLAPLLVKAARMVAA